MAAIYWNNPGRRRSKRRGTLCDNNTSNNDQTLNSDEESKVCHSPQRFPSRNDVQQFKI